MLSDQGRTGLPLAVQIAAPRWRDPVVLATAAVLEKSVVQIARADQSSGRREGTWSAPSPRSQGVCIAAWRSTQSGVQLAST